jgi:hypothetical protein
MSLRYASRNQRDPATDGAIPAANWIRVRNSSLPQAVTYLYLRWRSPVVVVIVVTG